MIDREKVIKGLECCKDIHTAGPGYAQGCILCPYGETPSDGAGGYACFRAMVKDAIVLLKAQEQAAEQLRGGYIENLITTAIALKLKNVSLPTDAALEMVRRLKAQEPRVMTQADVNNIGPEDVCAFVEIREETHMYACYMRQYDETHTEILCDVPDLPTKIQNGCARIWTARPTDEQRRVVKWDADAT